MKATMSMTGVITITAESGAEAFALDQWEAKSKFPHDDPTHFEKNAWRGSALKIETKYEQEK